MIFHNLRNPAVAFSLNMKRNGSFSLVLFHFSPIRNQFTLPIKHVWKKTKKKMVQKQSFLRPPPLNTYSNVLVCKRSFFESILPGPDWIENLDFFASISMKDTSIYYILRFVECTVDKKSYVTESKSFPDEFILSKGVEICAQELIK